MYAAADSALSYAIIFHCVLLFLCPLIHFDLKYMKMFFLAESKSNEFYAAAVRK